MRTLSRSLITVLVAIVIGGIAVGACLAALIPGTVEIATGHHYTAEQVKDLKKLAEPSTIYYADGALLGTLGSQSRQPITSLGEVPKMVQDAIIATEDRSFWTNDGIDLGAVFRAFLTNITSGRIEQGGSTITQQLVKNRILTSKRDVNRKIKEIEDALRLNEKFSKQKILVEYLDTVYFGSGSYGIKAAASRFFGKSLDQLTLGEAALLAGVISNPSAYNPFDYFDRAVRRRADVLRGMVSEGYITQAQADAANNEQLPTERPPANPVEGYDFLTTEVRNNLLADPRLGTTEKERLDAVLKGGLKVYTTFDPVLQEMAIRATTDAKPPSPSGPDWIASLVAIDPATGAVKAMVGGDNFSESQFNVATSSAGRQTGSTFKVITLAAALANGYSPRDAVDGTEPCPVPSRFPLVPPEQWPNNSADGAENGYHSLRESTAHSINCAFVRLATSVGLDKVIATAHAMGIEKNNLEPLLSLTLGTREQNTMTMAAVMATIANGGVHHSPYVVQKIVAGDGTVIVDRANDPGNPALSPEVANCTADILIDAVTAGTGGNAAIDGHEIFGKTGTTDNTTDAWFIGANPPGGSRQLATAVWFGNRTGNIAGAGFGGDSAAPIFADFMARALAGQAPGTMPDPGPVCGLPGGRVNQDGGRGGGGGGGGGDGGGQFNPAPQTAPATAAPTAPPTVPAAPAPTAPPTLPAQNPVGQNDGTGDEQ